MLKEGESVTMTVSDLCRHHGVAQSIYYPRQLRQDNGPEFTAHALEIWAEEHGVKLDFIKPGTPTQNAYIERFNRTYRNDSP